MRSIDIVAAIVMLAFAAFVALATMELPYWSAFAPGPSFMSLWVAAVGAVTGIALLVSALRRKTVEPADWPERDGARRVVLGVGALVLLAVLLPWAGALIAGFVFMMVFLMAVERRPLLPSLFTAAITVALFEGVFVVWLGIDLPRGWLSL